MTMVVVVTLTSQGVVPLRILGCSVTTVLMIHIVFYTENIILVSIAGNSESKLIVFIAGEGSHTKL